MHICTKMDSVMKRLERSRYLGVCVAVMMFVFATSVECAQINNGVHTNISDTELGINEANFSKSDFERSLNTISSPAPDFCFEPMNPGKNCKASKVRFYYNSTVKKCVEFTYVGCNGNGNRFFTKDECDKTCHGTKEIKPAIQEKRIDPQLRCNLDIHFLDKCMLTSNLSRIMHCSTLGEGEKTNERTCNRAGCCWHHSFGICYNYAVQSMKNVWCSVISSGSKSSFYVYTRFQSRGLHRHGWVGYLTFQNGVAGDFCMLKTNQKPDIIVGPRFMDGRGVILEGTRTLYPGDVSEVIGIGTIGNRKISRSSCQRNPKKKGMRGR